MPLDSFKPDDDEEGFEPLGVHEGADELPRKNFDVDTEVSMKTSVAISEDEEVLNHNRVPQHIDAEDALFPSDKALDHAVEEMEKAWGEESMTFHWVDYDELWAWHNGEELERDEEGYRRIQIICKSNSKYRTYEDGSPSPWLRALSGQDNLSTIKRIVQKADKEISQTGRFIFGCESTDNADTDFSQVVAVPQNETPLWQEFLMERDQWLDSQE